ncbi:MAG TPA: non-canonical purine NTP pyrophosphatase [Gemmatimonadales bacterium]|nr:non-canonical purine NTP pyrophosphatase [Gemmatimonadales bacterium]
MPLTSVRLLFASRSAGKQREVKRVLEAAGHEVVFPDDVGVWESEAEDGLELGESFEANARSKAEYFIRKCGVPTLADDSGLEVLSLGGAPGVRSKRWAGATGTAAEVDAANNAELLRRLLGAPATKRSARYRCVMVFLSTSTAVPVVVSGETAGRILEAPEGTNGFGYDPLFWSADLGKSFGMATAEEKDGVSHRGRALAKLVQALNG